jgi:hypothetical protein
MSDLKIGDRVTANVGSVDAIFAEESIGVVAELKDPKPYSGNDSNNLVRWKNGEGILMGFDPNDVSKIND